MIYIYRNLVSVLVITVLNFNEFKSILPRSFARAGQPFSPGGASLVWFGDKFEQRQPGPEEALVVKEVSTGVTPDTLGVPLLVQHGQQKPGPMDISISVGIRRHKQVKDERTYQHQCEDMDVRKCHLSKMGLPHPKQHDRGMLPMLPRFSFASSILQPPNPPVVKPIF